LVLPLFRGANNSEQSKKVKDLQVM
jgi:hypothetical protein